MSQWQLKKTYPDPYQSKRQFNYKDTKKVFERRRKTEQKRELFTDLELNPRVSRQNKFESAPFGALST